MKDLELCRVTRRQRFGADHAHASDGDERLLDLVNRDFSAARANEFSRSRHHHVRAHDVMRSSSWRLSSMRSAAASSVGVVSNSATQ